MGHIGEKDQKILSELFDGMEHEVKVLFFTQENECQYCSMTREIVTEVTDLSGKVSLATFDFVADQDQVAQYGIDKIPAIVIMGEKDYGIRYYGVPAGYEFTSLIEDIVDVGRRDPQLPEPIKAELAKIDKPVHIQVLISPTCPLCPAAVRIAHKFAMANEHILADMIEVSEFPFLGVKYQVQGVPHSVINEKEHLIGAAPEMDFVQAIQKALKQS